MDKIELGSARPPARRLEMPDIFGGAEKKTRPASVTIGKDRGEIFSFLSNFSRWPRFLRHVARVESLGQGGHRWTAQPRGGKPAQWETETLVIRPEELIAWRTKAGAPVRQTGAFLLESVPGGTIVSLKLTNDSAFGKIAAAFERFTLTDPDSEALRELQRLKALLETGEVPTVEGQPSGREGDLEKERVA